MIARYSMELETMKTYLRIDDDMMADDRLIKQLMNAADEYILQQTGKTQMQGASGLIDIRESDLYNQVLEIIVAHWYENRGIQMPGTLTNITYSAEMLLNHIAMSGEYV